MPLKTEIALLRESRDTRPFEGLTTDELRILEISLRGQGEPKEPGKMLSEKLDLRRLRLLHEVEEEQGLRQIGGSNEQRNG